MQILSYSISKPGGRTVNEDSFGMVSAGGVTCWIVADGLGGHGGGAVASKLAVEAVSDSFRKNPHISPDAVRNHIEIAQQSILQGQKNNADLASMRSTIVLLISDGNHAIWGHVGDSRFYHFTSGKIIFQSKDHSVPQMLVDAGDIQKKDIRNHDDRNRLLKSLGNEGKFSMAVADEKVKINNNDAFLLCTDGFWEFITEMEMSISFSKSESPKKWLENMEKILLINPKRNIDHDNYTAFAIMMV